MPSTGPIRSSQRVLVVVLALLGLAAGAAGLAVAAGTGLHESAPATRIGWGIGILCFGVLIGLAANYNTWRSQRKSLVLQSKSIRLRNATGAILFAGALVVPILLISMSQSSSDQQSLPGRQSTGKPPPTPPQPQQTFATAQPGHHSGADLTPLLAALAALIIAIGLGLLIYRLRDFRLRPASAPIVAAVPDEPASPDQALADAMSAGRRALQGDDVRAAIIACYAAMEQSLAAAGVSRTAADSPAELLGRAQARGLLSGPGPQWLAALFREARFSANPMGEQQMATAREALALCVAQLGTARGASQPDGDRLRDAQEVG